MLSVTSALLVEHGFSRWSRSRHLHVTAFDLTDVDGWIRRLAGSYSKSARRMTNSPVRTSTSTSVTAAE
jgi:hypothetical protein